MKKLLAVPIVLVTALAGAATRIVQDQCGPFSDVTPQICPYVLEMYYLGITAGTSSTTYSPDATVTRGQAAVFVSKGVNQAIARSSRRAALGQWWATDPLVWSRGIGTITLPSNPGPFGAMTSDGTDVWVGAYSQVFRVRASDGRVLETWTIDKTVTALMVAMGRVFVTGMNVLPPAAATLYAIDPSQPAGAATSLADLPDPSPVNMAFDGMSIWITFATGVGVVTPVPTPPWPASLVTQGFQYPSGIVFDGAHVWVTETNPCSLLKLDAAGAILQTVAACSFDSPAFDGANLVVPGNPVQVVRVSDGALIQSVPVGGAGPDRAIFDGERILLVDGGASQSTPPSLTLLRAADFALLKQQFFGPISEGVAGGTTDGQNFWVIYYGSGNQVLARY